MDLQTPDEMNLSQTGTTGNKKSLPSAGSKAVSSFKASLEKATSKVAAVVNKMMPATMSTASLEGGAPRCR